MTVRRLTAAHRAKHEAEPSCMATWPKLYGWVDMEAVARVICSPLLTPRDFKSFYRIVNRSMLTRNINPEATCSRCPRLCGMAEERFSHISKCKVIRLTFRYLHTLARRLIPNLTFGEKFVMLGLHAGEPHARLPGLTACYPVEVHCAGLY